MGAAPIRAQGRYLFKAEFQDAIRLRLGIEPANMKTKCVCRKENSVSHSKNCHFGGYINMRHDKIRDFLQDKTSQIYHDVEKEYTLKPVEDQILQPGANVAIGARTDLRIMGFTRDFVNTHFDVKIINAQADTHMKSNPKQAMTKAEEGKERAYKERIEKVEGAVFVPMVFSSRGAKSRKTARVISKIVTKLAAKRSQEKAAVAKALATELSFMFLRMELACIRGHRKTRAQNNIGE